MRKVFFLAAMFLASACTCAVYGNRRLLQSAHVQVLAKNIAAKKNTLRFCSRSYVSVCKYSVTRSLTLVGTFDVFVRKKLTCWRQFTPSWQVQPEFLIGTKYRLYLPGWREFDLLTSIHWLLASTTGGFDR